jgi:crotonobetainyl-CoA:carnitine CoA-transferase CaiB-like acyl-CoA transferase
VIACGGIVGKLVAAPAPSWADPADDGTHDACDRRRAHPDCRHRRLIRRNAYRERDTIVAVLAGALRHRRFADIAAAFDAAGFWYGRVEDYDDLFDNPQLQHNGTFRDVAGNGETIKFLSHPMRYEGKTPDACAFALHPGAGSRDVLQQAGFGETKIRVSRFESCLCRGMNDKTKMRSFT